MRGAARCCGLCFSSALSPAENRRHGRSWSGMSHRAAWFTGGITEGPRYGEQEGRRLGVAGTRRRSGDAAARGWMVNEIPSTPGVSRCRRIRFERTRLTWGGSRRDSFLLPRSTPSPSSGGPRFRWTELVGDLIRSVRRRQQLLVLRQRALVVQLPNNRNTSISEHGDIATISEAFDKLLLIRRLCCSCSRVRVHVNRSQIGLLG